MSILGNIMSAIFRGRTQAQGSQPLGGTQGDAVQAGGSRAGSASQASTSPSIAPSVQPAGQSSVDVEAILSERASQKKQKLDWRHSIVDLMKLLDLDSSLGARKELARELGYTGDMGDSAAMNIWLHKQVMKKLAENGGKVPADLMG
jgi:hypothetical protein